MKTFEALGIRKDILRALTELGFEQPMPVQEKVIPLLLEKPTDIIGLAQTGTGKTAAFGIPIIQQIDTGLNQTQALILAPTRELCIQISDDLADYARHVDDVRIVPVYGGASIEMQIRALKKGVHIIVATPGRLIDLLQRKAARLSHVVRVVLDEADEMLNMGFTESIDTILESIPGQHNTLLFSATMPPEIASISRKYMNNPVEVVVGHKDAGAENVKHLCYTVHAKDKYQTLKRIIDYNPKLYGIVFCRTRRETQEIADKLIQDGYNAESLHGDLSQSQRDFVMQKFRIRALQLLIATDVAARGIDVDDLTHIINYNLPDEIDAYTHRSGRTGRAGKAGTSIAIINMKEKHFIKQIEKKIGKTFQWVKVPSGNEVCEKQLFHLIDKIERIEVDMEHMGPFLPVVFKKLDWMDKEELIKRLVSVEFNRFLQYYSGAKDLNQNDDQPRRQEKAQRGPDASPEKGFTRIFINAGKIDGMNPNFLIELVRNELRNNDFTMGWINIMKKHTLFEIDDKAARAVLKAFDHVMLDNRKLFVKVDQENSNFSSRRDKPIRKEDRRKSYR